LHERQGLGVVAVDANGLGFQLDLGALNGFDFALFDEFQHLGCHHIVVVDHGTGQLA
jgi:hypothetical protein